MSVFSTAAHLASWAGTAPGSNESAGRVKSTKTRPGNRHLKGALGIAAMAASRSGGTYFSAKYRRIASRRGPMKALIAVKHSMLIAAWNMLTNGDFYRDPGADYFTARQPSKTKARAINQLESLGYRSPCSPSPTPHNHTRRFSPPTATPAGRLPLRSPVGVPFIFVGGTPRRRDRRSPHPRQHTSPETTTLTEIGTDHRCGTARRGAARHGTARHGTARHGTARHGTARHGTTRRVRVVRT